jgi:hypothetical protein
MFRIVAPFLLLLLASSSAVAQSIGLQSFGDSLTDEYFEDGYGYGRSWFEQVRQFRTVNGGVLAAGTWGEPRRTGYSHNWSRFAASTSDQLGSFNANQAAIALQVSSGNVTHSSLMVGNNNFGPWNANYGFIYGGGNSTAIVNQALADVNTLVTNIRATGSSLVLASIYDSGIIPWTRNNTGFNNPASRALVRTALVNYNQGLRAIAQANGIPFIDVFAFGEAIFGRSDEAADPNRTLLVGNVSISVLQNGLAASNGFVQDGIHPHSVVQGIMANIFMEAMNQGYGTNLSLFSENEIVTNAGLVYGGSDTLPFAASAFVTNYAAVPEVQTVVMLLAMGIAAVSGTMWWRRERHRRLNAEVPTA